MAAGQGEGKGIEPQGHGVWGRALLPVRRAELGCLPRLQGSFRQRG